MTTITPVRELQTIASLANRLADLLETAILPGATDEERASTLGIRLDAGSVAVRLSRIAIDAQAEADARREARAEKQVDRRAEEAREVAHMLGGAL